MVIACRITRCAGWFVLRRSLGLPGGCGSPCFAATKQWDVINQHGISMTSMVKKAGICNPNWKIKKNHGISTGYQPCQAAKWDTNQPNVEYDSALSFMVPGAEMATSRGQITNDQWLVSNRPEWGDNQKGCFTAEKFLDDGPSFSVFSPNLSCVFFLFF